MKNCKAKEEEIHYFFGFHRKMPRQAKKCSELHGGKSNEKIFHDLSKNACISKNIML